ncbi:MAG: sigma-70 family RNA polymerase sigma factor [Thermoanaerobaculia bacterium]|nr:sigma-70 family RNA polymerase sigma factor [Thermoanaerobaculia bacterium]
MQSDEIAVTATEVDDASLVERMAEGDETALGALYDRFSGMLLGLARRVLHSTSDAEEVLQEVFLQVWRQAGRYDRRKSSVSTWLVLITRSRSIDRLRSRKVKDRTLDQVRQEKPTLHTSPQGQGSVLLEQRRERLDSELAELPPEQRQVLELAFFAGMTQSEIASATDIPLGTVKTRTLLAMKKLRKALEEDIRSLL